MARKLTILLAAFLLFSIGVMAVAGCGGDENGDAVNGEADDGIVVPEPEPIGPSDDPLVGMYEGEYIVEGAMPEQGYPFVLIVGEDLSIAGEGAMPTGSANFSVSGIVSPEGDFTAGGIVEGAGMEVTFMGEFTVMDETVIVSGTWTAEGGMNGTWTGEKVD